MAISGDEAAFALAEIQQVQRRTRSAAGYEIASPFLIVWGVVWLCGYAACGVLPVSQWGYAWLPLVLLGVVASAVLGTHVSARTNKGLHKGTLLRPLLSTAVITVFLSCSGRIVGPISPNAYIMLPALTLGLVYTLVGLATLPRFAWIGAIIFILAMVGYWIPRPLLPFWMAGVGGGGLIFGGLWLRRI